MICYRVAVAEAERRHRGAAETPAVGSGRPPPPTSGSEIVVDTLLKPPQWLIDLLPEGGREFLENGGWYGTLGVLALIVLVIVWKIVGGMIRALFAAKPVPRADDNALTVHVAELGRP